MGSRKKERRVDPKTEISLNVGLEAKAITFSQKILPWQPGYPYLRNKDPQLCVIALPQFCLLEQL